MSRRQNAGRWPASRRPPKLNADPRPRRLRLEQRRIYRELIRADPRRQRVYILPKMAAAEILWAKTTELRTPQPRPLPLRGRGNTISERHNAVPLGEAERVRVRAVLGARFLIRPPCYSAGRAVSHDRSRLRPDSPSHAALQQHRGWRSRPCWRSSPILSAAVDRESTRLLAAFDLAAIAFLAPSDHDGARQQAPCDGAPDRGRGRYVVRRSAPQSPRHLVSIRVRAARHPDLARAPPAFASRWRRHDPARLVL